MSRPEFHVETLETGPNLVLGRTRRYARQRLTLTDTGIVEPRRILHLTDLHCLTRWQPAYDRLHRQVADEPPDLILLTGDYVDDRFDHRGALPVLRRLLAGLSARFGMFGIVGNHDTDLLLPKLADMGVTLLHNEGVSVGGVELLGLAGVRRGETSRAWLAMLPPPMCPRLVLTHYPDAVRHLGTLDAMLVLAGHTHGGQICLPGGKPLLTHDTLGRGYHRGVHRYADTLLLVSTGLGCSTHHLRTWCPPEVWDVVVT